MVGTARKLERERENKTRGIWKNGGGEPLRFFFALFFSIHAFPTISEPGTGYAELTGNTASVSILLELLDSRL